MKQSIIFCAVIIAAIMLSCKQEQPAKTNSPDEILYINHRFYRGECLGYCDTKLFISPNQIEYTKDGWMVDSLNGFVNLPTINSTHEINIELWNSFTALINIDDIMKLDSAYMYDDEGTLGASEGFFEIELITTQNSKSIKFFSNKYLKELDSLNKVLTELRAVL